MNDALVEGISVLKVYETGRKLKELALLRCEITLEYDAGTAFEAEKDIKKLFDADSLPVAKKSKNGPVEQDIIPMIRSVCVNAPDACTLVMDALICCQNPSLNPMQLPAAIERYLPQWKPDYARCTRIEIYDDKETVFR